MTNKEIIFNINIALEDQEKGRNKSAKHYFEKATKAMNSGKFKRHTKQGQIVVEYWNQAFDKIV
jgi:hypothetical protein